MADDAKKLWVVGVTKEVEGDAYVWAETQAEAEKIAESDVELDDYDGWTHAYAKEAKADRLKLKEKGRGDDDWDLDDRVFGDPPDGVGDTLGHALDWLTLSDEAVRSCNGQVSGGSRAKGSEGGSDPFARRGMVHAARPRCGADWPSIDVVEPGDLEHRHRCCRSAHRLGTCHRCNCGGTLRPKERGVKIGRASG